MITIEITARRLSSGADEVLRFSDAPYRTKATDTPAFAWFDPRISTRPSLGRVLFEGSGSFGASRASAGSVSLSNNDGALDLLVYDYAFDGRLVVVRRGDPAVPYAAWAVIMSARLQDVTVDGNTLRLVIRDRLTDLTDPLPRPKYLGDNVAPLGVEGTAADLKDQYKPRIYGVVLNVTAKAVNTSKLIYQVSDAACLVTEVYDNGKALGLGAPYVDQAEMIATAPAAGQARCFQGLIRLGSTPVGPITVYAETVERRAAGLLRQIAIDAGVDSGDIDGGDVDALNTANSAPVGVWVTDETSAQQAMDDLAQSIGAWYGFDRLNVMRMGRLVEPAGEPVATFGKREVKSFRIREAGIPVPRTVLRYARNYTTQGQPAELADPAHKAWVGEEFRTAATDDEAVLPIWPHAEEFSIDTLLVLEADAVAESARQQELRGVRRTTVDVDVFASELGPVDLGQVVALDIPRYGLDTRLYVLIGLDTGFTAGKAKLVLWG